MENLEENLPPVKKLKQAKLSFTVTPEAKSAGKIKPQGQGKKRKNSSSNDSPSKSSKPLIALGNSESPNAKSAKLRKISFTKPNDDNDHEVSSSSEAESVAVAKTNNGKCCLMERFVRKLPQDCHQEISSTNEILNVAVDVEPSVIQETSEINDVSKGDAQNVNEDSDCVIIDVDKSENENAGNKANGIKDEESKPNDGTGKVFSKAETKSCEHVNFVSVGKQTQRKRKETDCVADDLAKSSKKGKKCKKAGPKEKKISPEENKKTQDVSEDTGTSSTEVTHDSDHNCSMTENDLNESSVSEESVNDSLMNSSCISNSGSTPKKDSHDESGLLSTSITPESTPKTPSTLSGKKGRKVDTAKKAAREAEKQRLKEEKEKARLEKKKKLEEEKAEKERIKKEKKDAKEKERQEQKEKLEKEKEEKEKAKEEERKKREEERLKKEEEKKQKQALFEAKQEEKRKKEEEKKQKEEEKLREEEEKKKKEEKTKQAFQSFFIKPKDNTVKPVTLKPSSSGMFIPFEVKKDMHLAPAVRRDALSDDKKNVLDRIISSDSTCNMTYLKQLRNGEVKPHKTGKILRVNPQPPEDIEIVHDSEALKKVLHKVKLLQFHTDYRPPYYGTWRKHPSLSTRNPWKKDESMFDYEVDSDDEWEEEEPGESLSCSDGEEEKGEEAEDEDDDGWMVPHGYLSEDEGCNEDDEITPEKLKLQQQAKAKAWEEEQKRKFQAAPLIAVGCFFEHSPSNTMYGDVRLLYEFRGVVLLPSTPIPTTFNSLESEKVEEQTAEGTITTPTLKGCPKKAVPEEAMPDLIRLVHGNTCGIKRLIREFRVFWLAKTSASQTTDPESSVREDRLEDSFTEKNDNSILETSVNEANNADDKIGEINEADVGKKRKEEGYGCSISKRQLELKISSMAVRDRRQGFKKICWYVHENILSQFNLADLKLPNEWVFLSSGPSKSPTPNAKVLNTPKTDVPSIEHSEGENTEEKDTLLKSASKDQRSIKDFALSKEELAKKIENQPEKATDVCPSNPVSMCQATPPDIKKSNNQRSIMDFAKKSGSKKNLYSVPEVPKKTASVPVEVIDVDAEVSLPDSNISISKDGKFQPMENSREQKISDMNIMSDIQGLAFENGMNGVSGGPNVSELNEEMEVESCVIPRHCESHVDSQSSSMDTEANKLAGIDKAAVLEVCEPEQMEIGSSFVTCHEENSNKDAQISIGKTKAMEPESIVIE